MRTSANHCIVYDDTCRGRFGLGLTHSWIAGAVLARAQNVADIVIPATSWRQAFDALLDQTESIASIQYWGHGKWGRALIANDVLDASALEAGHPLHPHLVEICRRMAPDATWWFRTCETFGCRPGHEFALRWTRFFERAAAGHTYIIGPWQSGLHVLEPGEEPSWSIHEGLAEGTPERPERAYWSGALRPSTITCLKMRLPR